MNKDAQFTDKRLESLQEPDNFAPSLVQARIALDGREAAKSGRWVWKLAVATAAFLLFIAVPTARAIAQTGTLSMDAYGQSLHETMFGVHRTVAHLIFEIQHLFGD
jgi:hypothetical protein